MLWAAPALSERFQELARGVARARIINLEQSFPGRKSTPTFQPRPQSTPVNGGRDRKSRTVFYM